MSDYDMRDDEDVEILMKEPFSDSHREARRRQQKEWRDPSVYAQMDPRRGGNPKGMRMDPRRGGIPQNGRADYNSYQTRRRRRKSGIIRKLAAGVIIFVAIVLLGVGAYIFAPRFIEKLSKEAVYTGQIDVTDTIAGEIAVWLSTVNGKDITVPWVKEQCGTITVSTVLKLDKNSDGEKIYSESIDEQSYTKLCGDVDNLMNTLLAKLVAERLVDSGYGETVSEKEAMEVAATVLGMDMASYIKENGVAIVPDLQYLNEQYTFGSGKYTVDKGAYTLSGDGGLQLTENVIKNRNSLVFTGSGRVFTKEVADE